jgi:hypothetical protein
MLAFNYFLTIPCSVSYDPITLEYNQDAEGETLKYMDDIVKWKVGLLVCSLETLYYIFCS